MFIRVWFQGINVSRGDVMSAAGKPRKIVKYRGKPRDFTLHLLNINILSNNRGPGLAILLKIIVITAFAYYVQKYCMVDGKFKK
jgi:hypothetical protein